MVASRTIQASRSLSNSRSTRSLNLARLCRIIARRDIRCQLIGSPLRAFDGHCREARSRFRRSVGLAKSRTGISSIPMRSIDRTVVRSNPHLPFPPPTPSPPGITGRVGSGAWVGLPLHVHYSPPPTLHRRGWESGKILRLRMWPRFSRRRRYPPGRSNAFAIYFAAICSVALRHIILLRYIDFIFALLLHI